MRHVYHPSFARPGAAALYAAHVPLATTATHWPDDLTRDTIRRMHFAGWMEERIKRAHIKRRWRDAYHAQRNAVVVGNYKLVYPAINRWQGMANQADDLAGEMHLTLLHAVAYFDPWKGIRFSTYAYTCFMRSLSRINQKGSTDIVTHAQPLNGHCRLYHDELPVEKGRDVRDLERLLAGDLLTDREKVIIRYRFNLDHLDHRPTLDEVGRGLGISKERVRQVEGEAIGKLRGRMCPA